MNRLIGHLAPESCGVSRKQERQFGFLFMAVFLIIAFWPLWPLHSPNPWWLAGAGVWAFAALFCPRLLAPLYRGWMKFGHMLGWINARLILGIVFFAIVMPIGLIMRLFGKDFLGMRQNRTGNYWVVRDSRFTSQSLRNQF